MKYILALLCCAAAAQADDPRLPRPDQVDKPENIKFIVPDKTKLAGIVVDNTEAKLVGQWKHSVHTPPFVGAGYIHDMKKKRGRKVPPSRPTSPAPACTKCVFHTTVTSAAPMACP